MTNALVRQYSMYRHIRSNRRRRTQMTRIVIMLLHHIQLVIAEEPSQKLGESKLGRGRSRATTAHSAIATALAVCVVIVEIARLTQRAVSIRIVNVAGSARLFADIARILERVRVAYAVRLVE